MIELRFFQEIDNPAIQFSATRVSNDGVRGMMLIRGSGTLDQVLEGVPRLLAEFRQKREPIQVHFTPEVDMQVTFTSSRDRPVSVVKSYAPIETYKTGWRNELSKIFSQMTE